MKVENFKIFLNLNNFIIEGIVYTLEKNSNVYKEKIESFEKLSFIIFFKKIDLKFNEKHTFKITISFL